MSFGDKSIPLKNFVSEDEIEEKKKIRQEEWEKVRRPDQPLECPEITETRSLYEQLEDQKQKKQDEYEEKHRFQSTVKGLNEDDSEFLNYVSDKQMEIEKDKKKEMGDIMKEIEDASVKKIEENSPKQVAKKTTKPQTSGSYKSQQTLLAGAVKRKSSSGQDDVKRTRLSNGDEVGDCIDHQVAVNNDNTNAKNSAATVSTKQPHPHIARTIGILPSLVSYDDASSDSESSSDDDGDEELIPAQAKA